MTEKNMCANMADYLFKTNCCEKSNGSITSKKMNLKETKKIAFSCVQMLPLSQMINFHFWILIIPLTSTASKLRTYFLGTNLTLFLPRNH